MPAVDLHHVVEGAGPPMLLLHGFPETHICWDAVVERLGSDFTLVRPDLRGYGDSPKPEGDYSKRAMAADVLALMRRLGHERFAVAGHDRGVLVAQRLALEHPDSVSHLAVLDNVPVVEMWESITADAALGAYHLSFLAQPPDLPERLLAGDPAALRPPGDLAPMGRRRPGPRPGLRPLLPEERPDEVAQALRDLTSRPAP